MNKQKKFFTIFLMSICCFFIVSCKSDVKEDYKKAVDKYIDEAENAVDDFTKISLDAVDDVIEDAEKLMDKATEEIEKVMDEYK